MPFDPNESINPSIQIPATKFSAAATLDTLDDLVNWVQEGLTLTGQIQERIEKTGSVGAGLVAGLEVPYSQLRRDLETLDQGTSGQADVIALWKRARSIAGEVSKGASISPNSPIAQVEASLNTAWSKLGFLSAVAGFHTDFAEDSTKRAANSNNRMEIASGAAIAAQLGLLPTDPSIFDMKKLREATRNATSACEEVARLRDQNQTDAKDWEQARTDEAATTDARVLGLIKAKEDQLAKLYKDHADRMIAIEANFKSRLVLGGPATYWKERATLTFNSAMVALAVFIILVVLFILAASTFGPEHVRHVLTAIQPDQTVPEGAESAAAAAPLGIGSTLLGFALITTPAIMALWVLMLISRIFRENFHLSNDARHRHMLITTYLALAEDADNPIDEKDRQYALSAIFSVPSEASADDALTAMGSVFNRR